MRSIADMLEASLSFDKGKHDHVITPEFEGRTVLLPDMRPARMEDRATTQICARLANDLGKPVPGGYFQWLDDDLYAENLNRHIARARRPEMMMRCHDEAVRAVVSPRYPAFGLEGMFENSTLLDVARRIAATQPAVTLVRPFVSRDHVVCRFTWRDLDAGNQRWGLGALLQNDETGGGVLRLCGLIQRFSCANSIIVDTNWELRHVGGKLKFRGAMEELTHAMAHAGKLAAQWLERMIAAEAIVLPNIAAEIDRLCKVHGWSEAAKVQIGIGTEGQETVAGLANGITFAAHKTTDSAVDEIQMARVATLELRRHVPRPGDRVLAAA